MKKKRREDRRLGQKKTSRGYAALLSVKIRKSGNFTTTKKSHERYFYGLFFFVVRMKAANRPHPAHPPPAPYISQPWDPSSGSLKAIHSSSEYHDDNTASTWGRPAPQEILLSVWVRHLQLCADRLL
ncbi:MAG: hypothetical protein ABJX82_00120, partial [Paracoccaceae bacterium]